MTSLGGGLIIVAILGLVFAERLWVRVLCGALLGLYYVSVLIAYFTGEIDGQYLMIPLLLLTFTWYVRDVKAHYGKY